MPWYNHNNNNGQGGCNSNNGPWGNNIPHQGPLGNKRNVLDAQQAVMDTETHPDVVATMGPFLAIFNGVHLNKLLNVQGKDFANLPTMPKHMGTTTNKSLMYYCKALGFCPGNGSRSGCKFWHVAGEAFSQEFVVELCKQIDPGIRMITSQGYLPESNKRQANIRGGCGSWGGRGGRGGRW